MALAPLAFASGHGHDVEGPGLGIEKAALAISGSTLKLKKLI